MYDNVVKSPTIGLQGTTENSVLAPSVLVLASRHAPTHDFTVYIYDDFGSRSGTIVL